MNGILAKVRFELKDTNKQAQFTNNDVLSILQGITAFLGAIAKMDPIGGVIEAVGAAGHFATRCNAGTLQDNLASVVKWMSFGQAYRAMEDSNELDFDKMGVEAVPEVMKVRNMTQYMFNKWEIVKRSYRTHIKY